MGFLSHWHCPGLNLGRRLYNNIYNSFKMSLYLADGLHRAMAPTSEVSVKLLWDDLETWAWKYVGELEC